MLLKSKLYAIGLLAAVGVAGFAAGAATMSRAESGARRGPRDNSYSSQLRDELHLSTVQYDSVRAILRSHRGEMQAIMAPIRAQMDSVRTRAHEEIRSVLTAEQRARYDEMLAREKARFDSAASGHPPRTGTR